jgi:hypothetical protein
MSQFGNTFQNLGQLAQRAGEGAGFNQRFAQERQLRGEVLRERQQATQAAGAQQDRDLRLNQLAAQNEATRFQQALAVEKEQRNAVRQEQEASISERQRDLANALKIRDMERLEKQLGLQERGEERLQQRQDAQFQPGNLPVPNSKQFNQMTSQLTSRMADLAKVLDPLSQQDLSDEQRLTLTNQLEQDRQALQALQESAREAARNVSANAQVNQQQGPVTAKDAGPALSLSLKAARQTRVLDAPLDSETGLPDLTKFKEGKIYQIPGKGPAVWVSGGFELIDELADVDTVRTAQVR